MSGKQQEHIPAATVEVAINYKLWLVRREDAVLLLRRVGTGGRGDVRANALTNMGLWSWEESGRCAACAPMGQNGAASGARRWPGGGSGG